MMVIQNGFTIDLEDYYHANKCVDVIAREKWGQLPARVCRNTEVILNILREYKVRGTFFVLGWVAERNKNLIREIAAENHEIGCHSYWHRKITQCTQEGFREDLRRAKSTIEEIIQKPVIGYRAPNFSIRQNTIWAMDILIEEGFLYDSSIFPMYPFASDIADRSGKHRVVHRQGGAIEEFPIATFALGKWNLPIGGGGYFRLLPYSLVQQLLHYKNRQGEGFTFYFHPWELDHQQPRLPLKPLAYFRQYVNLSTARYKLRKLVASFSFVPLRELLFAKPGGSGNKSFQFIS